MPAVNAASRPPRLDSMVRCRCRSMHALQSRRPLSGTIASFETDDTTFARIGAVHLLSWLAADKRPGRRVQSELIEKRRAKRGRQVERSTLPSPNLFCSFSVALESLAGSTNRGQRPRMAGLKWTMLDLETGGMRANAAVRWRSQACVAACPWPYRSATSTTGEMSFSLASIQVPKPKFQWPLLKSACQKQTLLTVQWAVQCSIVVPNSAVRYSSWNFQLPPVFDLLPPISPSRVPPLPSGSPFEPGRHDLGSRL